jgi:glycerophosphoryl diester phosphodiesterase
MISIAHRGASAHAPEHTFAAYDLALEIGCDYLELDLQLTRDGAIVALHDTTLERTLRGDGCAGPVLQRSLAEVQACDAGRWFNEAHPDRARAAFIGQRVPTLDEVLARFGRSVKYYLELKSPEAAPGIEARLLETLGRFGLRDAAASDRHVLVESFSESSLQRVRALDARLPLVQLFEDIGAETIVGRLGGASDYAVGVAPHRGSVTPELTAAAHRHGLLVHAWTVNEPAEMERFRAWGVDGVFTDYPDRLARLR